MFQFTNVTDATIDGARVEVVLAKPVDKNDYRNYTRGKSAFQQVTFNAQVLHYQLSYML